MKRRNVAIVHYNTPELTEATILSLRKHGGMDYTVYVLDNSDRRPFCKRMDGVTIIDNTKGQVIDFDEELAKYPDRVEHIGKTNNFGSVKHMMSVQKLWELIPDGFLLMDSDILIQQDVDFMFMEDQCTVGHVQDPQPYNPYGTPRLLPLLLWINVPLCKKGGAKFFDPNRSWGLLPDEHARGNWYDTGAAFYEDIRTKKPGLYGLSIDIRPLMLHYMCGSWKRNDLVVQQGWLNDHRYLWEPNPMMRGVKDVAVCAIGRQENKYAVEWVEHYRKLGVSKLFIYDNNFGDEERFEDVLQPYVDSGLVEIIDWRDKPNAQTAAYNDCYRRHGNEYAWMGFLDFDELLVIGKKKVKAFFGQYGERVDCVLINWRIMTDGGHVRYEDKPMMKRFREPMAHDQRVKYDFPENNHVKCFVRGGIHKLEFQVSPHVPATPILRCVDARGNAVKQDNFVPYDFRTAYINHYHTKTAEEFVEKCRRGFPTFDSYTERYRLRAAEFFFRINERTEEKEKVIGKPTTE